MRGCRRARSPARDLPRSKPPPTRQRSTTSITSSSREPAANSPSPRAIPNSKPTSPVTTKPAKQPAASRRPHAENDHAMPRLAVLGHPVAHSRSPVMHAAALADLGLAADWSYEAIDVAPDEFEAQVHVMPSQGFVGAN